ncbi:MAG: acyltransferase [Lachnospiraceae bacterium]|nr:acyltransferase [Lachnospiraceae bacterium]
MDWFRVKHTLGMCLCGSGVKRAKYLKKHKVLKHIGDNCMVMFRKIPLYPELISIGNNVWIASNVSLITHDVVHRMINNRGGADLYLAEYKGEIKIDDNVFIGANTSILPGVHIGRDTIIGAGTVVNKDISDGVYAGVPVRYLCSLEDFIARRKQKE